MVNFRAFDGCRGSFHEMIKEREQTLPLRSQTVSSGCPVRILQYPFGLELMLMLLTTYIDFFVR
jgi:histidinol phosphatase-like PHP family hydrolase